MLEQTTFNHCYNLYTDKDINDDNDRNNSCDYDIYIVFAEVMSESEVLDIWEQVEETVREVVLDMTLSNYDVKTLIEERVNKLCGWNVIYVAVAKRIFISKGSCV